MTQENSPLNYYTLTAARVLAELKLPPGTCIMHLDGEAPPAVFRNPEGFRYVQVGAVWMQELENEIRGRFQTVAVETAAEKHRARNRTGNRPGRPATAPRCKCGRMTVAAAKSKSHQC